MGEQGSQVNSRCYDRYEQRSSCTATRPRGQTLKAKIMGKDEIENETFKTTTTAVAYM